MMTTTTSAKVRKCESAKVAARRILRAVARYSLFPIPYSLLFATLACGSADEASAADAGRAQAAPTPAPAPVASTVIQPLAPKQRLDAQGRRELRVCADPNNLPFSNQAGEGFENRLAELLARDMGARVKYTWWAQRRGFIRNTLRTGECDLVTGVPASFELVLPTRPYYRSTYVFVYREDADFDVASFDDPVLKRLKIGVHLIGDDGVNVPPAHALGTRGIVGNVRGYMIYGDYGQPNPPARILDALAEGEIDLAIVWGPLAGYFAPKQDVALKIVPVLPQVDLPFLPMVYDIAMGVRRDDPLLMAEVQQILQRRRAEVDAILDEYGVPRVGPRRIPSE
jgi:mxaJ protein